jgi:hypothetical protein
VEQFVFRDSVLEIFDEKVADPPVKIRLEQVEATLRDVDFPGRRGRSPFTLDGAVKGAARDGHAHLTGWAAFGLHESSVATQLRSVDLVVLEPYLVRQAKTGIRAGTLDLEMQSDVRAGQIKAAGRMVITGLELEPDEGLVDTVLGLSRRAMLAALRENDDKIALEFTLEGEVHHPKFSLEAAPGTKLAYSIVEALGLSLGGLVEGVATIGLKGGEVLGDTALGLGEAVWDLFDSAVEW